MPLQGNVGRFVVTQGGAARRFGASLCPGLGCCCPIRGDAFEIRYRMESWMVLSTGILPIP